MMILTNRARSQHDKQETNTEINVVIPLNLGANLHRLTSSAFTSAVSGDGQCMFQQNRKSRNILDASMEVAVLPTRGASFIMIMIITILCR